MINKKAVMYHNLINDLEAIETFYENASDDIKALIKRAKEQAHVELRKEEKQ